MTSKLCDCPICDNSYLAIRTDIYKDKRDFVYCDVCGAMADIELWKLMTNLLYKNQELVYNPISNTVIAARSND